MDSGDLIPDQAAKIMVAIGGTRCYLDALLTRMGQEAFPADDSLLLATRAARDALDRLRLETRLYKLWAGKGGAVRERWPNKCQGNPRIW